MDIVLTGIKPTGTLHIGNYVGAIKPAIAASAARGVESYFFLADYHAIGGDADTIARATLEIAASWLALGLDPSKVVFYRQSDIPEILELQWILTSVTAKGLMNRAHAYKAAVDENTAAGADPDQAVMMNLYSYPILMAADILMFKAAKVPVGRDQKQHVEMARDIAQRFNHHYGETFVLPDAVTRDEVATLPGLDGRKMSKSYGNVVPLFADSKALRKLVMKIKTNSLEPGQPKDTERQRAVRDLPRVRDARRDGGGSRALRGRHRLGRDEAAAVRAHRRGARAGARGVRAADRVAPGSRAPFARGRRESARGEQAVHRRDPRPRRNPAARALSAARRVARRASGRRGRSNLLTLWPQTLFDGRDGAAPLR